MRKRFPLLLLSALLLGALPSCQNWPAAAGGVASGLCAGAGVAESALGLLPQVIDVFRGGGSDYVATLDKIRVGVGAGGSMACAVAKALAHFERTPPDGGQGAEADSTDVIAAERARAYLKQLRGPRAAGQPGAALSPGRLPAAAFEQRGLSATAVLRGVAAC